MADPELITPVSTDEPASDAAIADARDSGAGVWWSDFRKWLLRASVAGVAVSLAVHVVLAIIAALVVIERPAGVGEAGPAEVELAVITQAELTELIEQGLRDEIIRIDDTPLLTPFADQSFDAPPIDAKLTALDAGDVSPLGGAADGLGAGADSSGLEMTGGAGAASFFGVEARGSRFVYIVDVSGSMGGPKIETLRRQLTQSVNGLLDHSSFTIFFFSHETHVLGGAPRWLSADLRFKQAAAREIIAVNASGGTNPMPSFEQALTMRPKPDAIYFMTDGVFHEAVVPLVAELNERGASRTPIHCISFISREAEDRLRQIARQSGGTYTHVADPNL